jgi:hypothetical protein
VLSGYSIKYIERQGVKVTPGAKLFTTGMNNRINGKKEARGLSTGLKLTRVERRVYK